MNCKPLKFSDCICEDCDTIALPKSDRKHPNMHPPNYLPHHNFTHTQSKKAKTILSTAVKLVVGFEFKSKKTTVGFFSEAVFFVPNKACMQS